MGDLLYRLQAIQAVCRKENKSARIVSCLNHVGIPYEGAYHPYGNITFPKAAFESAKPLIESLDFVESFEVWEGQYNVDFNLDLIRDHCNTLGMPHTEIRQWAMMLFPRLNCVISKTWLPRPRPAKEVYICVNRTHRYRNENINYSFLGETTLPIVFVGMLDEYDDFIKQVPSATYVKTANMKEAAGVIGSSCLFIGNQSSCFAIAEGMGQPRLLELFVNATNVIPCTPNGSAFLIQSTFEYLVFEAVKSLEVIRG